MSSENGNQTDFSAHQYLLGLSGMLSPFVIVIAIIMLWPDDATSTENYVLSGEIIVLSYQQRVLLIVALSGALGSIVHVATSFSTYVGNKAFIGSWVWWYVLRVPIGMSLALIVYFTMSGGAGLFPADFGENTSNNINLSGFAALAGVTGMFSRQATDKLEDLFETILRAQGNAKRHNKLYSSSISITKIELAEIIAKQPLKSLIITGSNFNNDVIVLVNGQIRKVEAKDSKTIICELEESDVASVEELVVTVIPSGEQDRQFERHTVKVKAASGDTGK